MGEFKLQHMIVELVDILGGSINPERLVENLQRKVGSSSHSLQGTQVASQSYIKRIAQELPAPKAEAFQAKYTELKEKNVDNLASYIELLHYISQDTVLKSVLLKSTKPKPNSQTAVTKDDYEQIKNRLTSRVKNNSSQNELLNSSSSSLLPIASTPSVSSWSQRRPHMSWDFPSQTTCGTPVTVPPISHENILIEDLLNVLIGLPGSYIMPEELQDEYGVRRFQINTNVHGSLRDLVDQILPLATYYSIIRRFIEEKMSFEYGRVNNALAEAMRNILKEHTLFIVQLESEFRDNNLNLQKMWYFVQSNLQSLEVAASIASSIIKSQGKGGKVLSLLHDNIVESIGNDKTQKLCLSLMESACVPYMQMLGLWIYRGIITDPIAEFLVEDNEIVQKEDMPIDYSADYWDKKYSIRRECVPKFLDPVTDIILKAGKYLNVIRQCGKPVKNKVLPILYKTEGRHYLEAIQSAYKLASQTLLDLVLKEEDLLGRLKSVKHYFLLDKGDFIVTFLQLCEKELCKPVGDVNQVRIEGLMDLALRLSSAIKDPYREDLRTVLLPHKLQVQMFKILSIQTNSEQDYWTMNEPKPLSVIESFSFSYEVHWPLSLILNRKSLACYQMIFRHMFYCKHVERMICQVWRCNKVAKKFAHDIAQHYRAAFALRQRMLHCVQNLEYHMMVEVIEPHWCLFLQKIMKVQNVDEILNCHSDFLDSCLKDCMLTIPHILGTIIKILGICVSFCTFMQTQFAFDGSASNLEPTVSFNEQISLLDGEFSGTVMKLLAQINDLNHTSSEHERLFNLLYRLDFNSFYTDQNESLGLKKVLSETSSG